MIRLQRYLFGELLAAFALVLLIITGVVFGGMLLRLLHQTGGLGLGAVLQACPYLLPEALPMTVPLSLLVACLLTYGRFSEDNEFLALQMGGVHPWHAVAPAVCLGVLLSLATLWVNTDVIPRAALQRKAIARDEIRRLATALTSQSGTSTSLGKSLFISWGAREGDWLLDVLITYEREQEDPSAFEGDTRKDSIRAERARVEIVGGDLRIDLRDAELESGGTTARMESQLVILPLDRFLGPSPLQKPKGKDEMTGQELYYRVVRAVDPAVRRKLQAAYWARIALGLAPLAFSLLGAPLGLATGRGSRTAALALALLVALPVYYPLHGLGENLAEQGTLPAPLALAMGDLLMAGTGIFFLRRVLRG